MGGTASQRETATTRPEMMTLTLSFSDVVVILMLSSSGLSESLCESSPSYDTRPVRGEILLRSLKRDSLTVHSQSTVTLNV